MVILYMVVIDDVVDLFIFVIIVLVKDNDDNLILRVFMEIEFIYFKFNDILCKFQILF